MTPVVVRATFDAACIGIDEGPVMLDGPLAWAYAQRALAARKQLPPMLPDYAPDFPLPLATFGDTDGPDWVWRTSQAAFDVVGRTTVEVRRKPETRAMARYTKATSHHAGLGPMKARDTKLPASLVRSATWHVVTTDRADLEDLLAHITHIGARHRNGFGKVKTWRVTEDTDVDAWMDRPMPDPDGVAEYGVRAPYWHHTRKTRCRMPA